jgi:glycosyltransferase involved in cell wall biosynthesis
MITKTGGTAAADQNPSGMVAGVIGAELSRPRVLLLTSHPVAPPWNGADKNLARMLLHAELGVDFSFVGGPVDTTPWPPGHMRNVLDLGSDMPTALAKLRLLIWLSFRSPTADVVHGIVTFKRSPITQWALLALPRLRQGGLVVTCPSGHYLPVQLLKRASVVVAVSRGTERRLQAAGIGNVRLISPGVDLDFFRPKSAEGANSAANGRRPTLLFAGHYEADGGLDAALELARRVRRSVPDLMLMVAMRRRPGYRDQQRQVRMREAARRLGLADALVELGSATDIRSALQSCSAVVYQPRKLRMKMDLPLTLLEALGCGRPLVVSPADTLGELADRSRAVVVDQPLGEASVHHLARLLSDHAYSIECERAARKLAERRYSLRPMLAAYRDVYMELASARVKVTGGRGLSTQAEARAGGHSVNR